MILDLTDDESGLLKALLDAMTMPLNMAQFRVIASVRAKLEPTPSTPPTSAGDANSWYASQLSDQTASQAAAQREAFRSDLPTEGLTKKPVTVRERMMADHPLVKAAEYQAAQRRRGTVQDGAGGWRPATDEEMQAAEARDKAMTAAYSYDPKSSLSNGASDDGRPF